jgi:hypothetical protein
LNCFFGDEKWSNPWFRFELFWGWELKQPLNPPEPSSVPSLLLREFLMLMLRGFQCSWGISWFGNFFVPLQWGGRGGGSKAHGSGGHGWWGHGQGGQQGKGLGEGGGTGRGLPSGRRSWVPTSMPILAANATGTR